MIVGRGKSIKNDYTLKITDTVIVTKLSVVEIDKNLKF